MTKETITHEIHAFLDELDDTLSYRHSRHPVGHCPRCDWIRVQSVTVEFIRRLRACDEEIEGLFMWSLGTSLRDTPSNRRMLMKRWRAFTKVMNERDDWVPLFRVVEVGRRGFLHFHVVAGRYIEHAIVLKAWRSLTREPSNVNVSGYKGRKNPETLVRYLVKYLSKSTSSYRWMGPLHGVGGRSQQAERLSGACDGSKRRLRYMGVVQGWSLPHAEREKKGPKQEQL